MLCTILILGAGPLNPQLKFWNMYITDMDNLCHTHLHQLTTIFSISLATTQHI